MSIDTNESNMFTLDNFYEPLNTPNEGSLIDLFAAPPVNFEEAMRERLKLREIMEEVLDEEQVEGQVEDVQTPSKDLCKQLTKAKEDLKHNIENYNKIKDEGVRLQGIKDKLHNVYTDVNVKMDFINNNIKPELLEGIDNNVKDIFKIYYDNVNKILSDNINQNNVEALQEKKKIKEYSYLFSYNSGGFICSICLTSEVSQFCEPCGHSYCPKCLKSSYCYICRVKINKVHRLFL
jgi:hypothetical protein